MTSGLENINVLDLLPQRPPFVMIDRLVHYDPVVTVSMLEVRMDNIFVDDGLFSTAGLNENIAQTCAARMGYISLSRNDRVKLGFIGAVSNFHVLRCPAVGQVLTTRIEVIEEVFQITLVHATVSCGDELLAETDLKIALED